MEHLRVLLIVGIMPWVTAVIPAQAQDSAPVLEIQRLRSQLAEQQRVVTNLMAQIAENREYSGEQKIALNAAKMKALQSYYNSQASVNENGDGLRQYQQQVFAWQLTAANWLLGVVVLLSVSGVAFAGYEMISTRGLIQRNVALAANATQANPPAGPVAETTNVSTITIEPTKVQITSAVIGIVILGLSLGFLYLFLREVYAIDVIDLTDTGRARLVSIAQPATSSVKPDETPRSASVAPQN